MIGVQSVEALEGYRLRVGFEDGTKRVVDVDRFLRGPIFEPIRRDRRLFEGVQVDPELKTVVWPNGADIDPDVLYGSFEPAWAEEKPSEGAA
ncbi:MAG: DUF2442 domain-containing protein [Longimicrobiales bacterium]